MEPNIKSLTLTIEQQFQMKLIKDSVNKMSREQMEELLIDLSQLVMLKDNAIKDLLSDPTFR